MTKQLKYQITYLSEVFFMCLENLKFNLKNYETVVFSDFSLGLTEL